MNRKWFYRMLLSYVPVFFIVIAFLIFIFFKSLSEINEKEAIKANQFLTQQAIGLIDNSLRIIDETLVRELITNKGIKAFFSKTGSVDAYRNIQAADAMWDLMMKLPLIQSVYFVRFEDQFVISNSSSWNMEEYPDYPFIASYMESPQLYTGGAQWSNRRTFHEFASLPDKQVVTLARKVPFLPDKGLVVVNINLESLDHVLKNMYSPEISFIDLYDRIGQPLLNIGNGKAQAASAQSADLSVRRIFSSITSAYTGWEMKSGLKNGNVVHFVQEFNTIWIVFGIAVIVLAVAWIVYVTRRNYKPIEQLVTRIQSYSIQRANVLVGGGNQNEIRFIETALEHMFDQVNQFQHQHAKDLILRKKQLFHEFIEGNNRINRSEWKEEMNTLGMTDEFSPSFVFVLEMDRYTDFCKRYNEHDQYLLKCVLYSVVQEMALNQKIPVWIEWTANSRFTCIAQSIGSADDTRRALQHFLESCLHWADGNKHFSVTIGLGCVADDIAGLRSSYEQAVEALTYKAVLGNKRIIDHVQAPQVQAELYLHMELIHSIAERYRLSDEEWQADYEQFFNQIQEALLPHDDIVKLLSYLITHLDRGMMALQKEFQLIWRTAAFPELNQVLGEFELLSEIRTAFLDILKRHAEQILDVLRSKNHHSLIRDIRKYIESHFEDPNLSLEYLGDKFRMKGKYVSKLFKDEFGENFVDFMIQLRIERAKTLLQESNMSIQEISDAVGYTSYISFTRVFKNQVGQSPSGFRKQKEL